MPGAIGTERNCPSTLVRSDEHFVEHAVVGAGEHRDRVTATHGASHADRRRHGFGARVAERDTLHPRQLRDHPRHVARKGCLRTDLEPLTQLRFDGLPDERRVVAEEDDAEAVREIDVLVAVEVPELRSGRPRRDDGIDDLLPE